MRDWNICSHCECFCTMGQYSFCSNDKHLCEKSERDGRVHLNIAETKEEYAMFPLYEDCKYYDEQFISECCNERKNVGLEKQDA